MRTASYTAEQQLNLLNEMEKHFGESVVSAKQIRSFISERKMKSPNFIFSNKARKVGWGKYNICAGIPSAPTMQNSPQIVSVVASNNLPKREEPAVADLSSSDRFRAKPANFIPEKVASYVPFGFFEDLAQIVESQMFYPVYITGLSGNGKTMMVEQVCAKLNRELIRVNITRETDETDLIGSYELIDGNTIRREGPAIIAMRRGAVLLLDETDYGSERLLCLQPILEGKPYFDKKTGEIIHPQPGFNVIATANTKGRGSEDGKFIGANMLNEAFLERFAITVEQQYPEEKYENKILTKMFKEFGIEDVDFIKKLTTWAKIIRKSYQENAVDEVISTRRLVHIAKAYSVFKSRTKAVQLCLNRFDEETKNAFYDLYTKVDVEELLVDDNENNQQPTEFEV